MIEKFIWHNDSVFDTAYNKTLRDTYNEK